MRILKTASVVVISVIFLASCAEPTLQSIVEENGVTRPANAKEQAMIDDMHYIIKALRNYDQSNPDQVNWLQRSNSKSPKVMFFGEAHNEIIGQIQTLAAINAVAKSGDVLLREGADRSHPHEAKCGLDLIFSIYTYWQWEKLGKAYDPKEHYKWRKAQRFDEMFALTKNSYDLTGISIADISCGFWDSGQHLNASMSVNGSAKDLTRSIKKNLQPRNQSMVEAIRDGLKRYRRVIVNAGYNHLPAGSMLKTKMRNRKISIPTDADDYYRLVDAELQMAKPTRSLKKLDGDELSTKVIHDYLKAENIPFDERIHGKMFN